MKKFSLDSTFHLLNMRCGFYDQPYFVKDSSECLAWNDVLGDGLLRQNILLRGMMEPKRFFSLASVLASRIRHLENASDWRMPSFGSCLRKQFLYLVAKVNSVLFNHTFRWKILITLARQARPFNLIKLPSGRRENICMCTRGKVLPALDVRRLASRGTS